MWITNGGFADLYVVFAKVDGEHFTAFLVERSWPGVSSGKEEHKMGLHGSSTTPVILQDVRVPAGNVLGEVGQGHKVAFNSLNYGRFKLAVSACGQRPSRDWRGDAVRGRTAPVRGAIASFGAIRHKLGEMAARAYAVDSMIYRTTGLLDAALAGHDPADPGAAARDAGGAGRRVVDPEGRGQRDAALRPRRERADSRTATGSSGTTRPSATTATRG